MTTWTLLNTLDVIRQRGTINPGSPHSSPTLLCPRIHVYLHFFPIRLFQTFYYWFCSVLWVIRYPTGLPVEMNCKFYWVDAKARAARQSAECISTICHKKGLESEFSFNSPLYPAEKSAAMNGTRATLGVEASLAIVKWTPLAGDAFKMDKPSCLRDHLARQHSLCARTIAAQIGQL